MKKTFLLVLLFPAFTYAQRLHLNIFGGVSNYFGDLQAKTFTLDQSYGAFGAGLQYDLTGHISVLSGFNIAHVGASDSYNKPSLKLRNLSFQTRIFEWNVMGEYNLFDLRYKRFTPYAFGGLAIYHYNPFAYDSLNRKVYLRPLSTEGEGLSQYPNRKQYGLTQLAIPFGLGIKLRVTDNVSIAYEIGFRKLFNDYLDDVSTTYVDRNILLAARGPKAVEMAYRGGEVKGGDPTYPIAGTLRGSASAKDWYYLTGIRVSIALGNNRTAFGHDGLNCPRPVR